MLELYHNFGTTFNFNLFHMLFWGKLRLWQLSKLKMTQFYLENKCISLMSGKYFCAT